jgi:hypothetical protein
MKIEQNADSFFVNFFSQQNFIFSQTALSAYQLYFFKPCLALFR